MSKKIRIVSALEADYALLTIPPFMWHGVHGLAPRVLPNDRNELDRKPIDAADVPYRWPAVAP